MSEQREAGSATGAPREPVKPPWWLITSWGRWTWFGFVTPALLGWSAVQRLQAGQGHALDSLMLLVLAASAVFALVQLVLTLRAFRQDPTLRTREWPSPPPGPGVSRRVYVVIALLATAAVSLVLLVYAGWPGALFVAVVLVGLLILFVRFDLFADDRPAPQDDEQLGRFDPPGHINDR